jgi:hypothetical protein
MQKLRRIQLASYRYRRQKKVATVWRIRDVEKEESKLGGHTTNKQNELSGIIEVAEKSLG